MVDLKKINISGCWDSSDFEYEGMNSHGRSGGLLSIWNNIVFKKVEVIKLRHYLIVNGLCSGINGHTIFANIYAPKGSGRKLYSWLNSLKLYATSLDSG